MVKQLPINGIYPDKIAASNSMRVPVVSQMEMQNPGKNGDVLLEVTTGGTGCIVTVKGANGYKDSVNTVPTNTTSIIGPFIPSRFNAIGDRIIIEFSETNGIMAQGITLLEV